MHGDRYDYSKVKYVNTHYEKHMSRIKSMIERQNEQKQSSNDESGIKTAKLP